MTQRETILQALRDAGQHGVCVEDLGKFAGYTARNRISELRRDGLDIASKPCHVHKHRSSVARYYLVESGQTAMAI